MADKRCPNCGLWNVENAVRCDCGYNFDTGKHHAHILDAPQYQTKEPTYEPFIHPLQPWFTIWIKPRQTIRQALSHGPKYQFTLLIILWGFTDGLDNASSRSLGDTFPNILLILALNAILGPIGAYISIYIGGAILQNIGRRFGGSARIEEVQASMLWSSIPRILAVFLIFPLQYLMFGFELFTSETPKMDSLLASSSVYALLASAFVFGAIGVGLILGIWSLVIFVVCLSEVNQFSVWRALATVFIPFAVLAGFIYCVVSLTG